MKVTKIEKQAKRDRYNIYLDGEYSFSLASKVLVDANFGAGDLLTESKIEILKTKDLEAKAVEKALHVLSYRVHSRKELQDKLSKKFEAPVVDKALEKIEQMGFIDDVDFAERYVEQSKKGKNLIKMELLKKGIDKDLVEKVIERKTGDTELENAQKVVEKVFKKYKGEPTQKIKQKLYENLMRRGFSYDLYKEIIKDINIK